MGQDPEKKKYRVNLPKTSFPMKASLAVREPQRYKQWEEEGLEKRLWEQVRTRDKRFILHDGPPYANGHIHIGHALNKTMKDMIVKFRTMQGYCTTYVPGWDCHGLPIEAALLKEQGKQKDQVDQNEFRKQARAYAGKYVKLQKAEFQRLGIFGTWEDPYLTMNPQYQASIAGAFYELYNKGYVYRGEKPVFWSIGAETALAEAELEYQDKVSQAIYVSFPVPIAGLDTALLQEWGVSAGTPVSYLIWTTTPWTLPANVGVALNEHLEYGVYWVNNKQIFICAAVLAGRLKEKFGIESIERRAVYTGSEIVRRVPEYQHPFCPRKGRAILADYVSGEDGTGIVHIAPGHGEEDYFHGHLQNGLPILSPVDHKGRFTEDPGEDLKIQGVGVFEANPVIVRHLESKGYLHAVEQHSHSYPFCWRTKTPVIVRSTPQWFLKVDHENLRERILNIIEDSSQTEWFPDWGKNRIMGMMETRPDWCLSRQRLWGVPVPVAKHKTSGEVYCPPEFQQRVLEVFQKESADAWFKQPKEYFFPEGAEGLDDFELETDILDVWFDSGVSHQAVLEQGHALGFPTELYLEGSDQHRGWFQTSMITAVALRGMAPFKQVLTHGFVMDGEGRKMSKSMGNVVSPLDVMKESGADILRLWVSSCDTNNDVRVGPEILARMSEAYRKIRNTFRYLLGNINDFDPKVHSVPFDQMDEVDRWILSRLSQVAGEVVNCYNEYRFHRIYQLIYDFCISDLSSFYLDVLKDRLYCDHPDSPQRRSTQSALFRVAKSLCLLTAPILVYTSDEVWRTFDPGTSVHEALWDESLWGDCDTEAIERWATIRVVRRVSDLAVEKMRATEDVGSPLDCEVFVRSSDPELQEFLQANSEALKLGLIVSGVGFGEAECGAEMSEEDLTVRIRRASGRKCARCWKYTPEVGTLDNPELCQRCSDVERDLAISVA
ncbi:MAG: isoleucine--tRNA ligase [Candidatus Omnitrophica bacterium]|nr:isoleucine--tRNA ligase [Candidatus Omnitrophota bacterium]